MGSRLEISFTLPHDRSGKIVTGEVIVVRRDEAGRAGFGARFFRLPQSAARVIEEFLLRSASRAAGAAESGARDRERREVHELDPDPLGVVVDALLAVELAEVDRATRPEFATSLKQFQQGEAVV